MAQHISLRVPWHDNGWNGTVCNNPAENISCLRLKNIFENRDDNLEEKFASCKFCSLACNKDMPCLKEGGAFMSDEQIEFFVEHPYSKYGYSTHDHLLPTKEIMPPYSYPARPYRWTMKRRYIGPRQYLRIEQLATEQGIDYHAEYEPEMKNKTWVQDGRNQRAIFNKFFEDVEPDKSLCIFYAKQVPFVEDSRRVVIGIGHVKAVYPSVDYETSDTNKMTSCTWETMIQHSIRSNMEDGFLLPYDKLTEYAETDPNFDINKVVVFAENDFFEEFSYASEHLSYDAVIDVILQCLKVIEIAKEYHIEGDWNKCITWLNQQLIEVWEDRGAFPGLGAMLTAFGVPSGVAAAKELKDQSHNSEDLWELLDKAIDKPDNYFSDFCRDNFNETIRTTWKNLPKIRKKLFMMLSRVDLSIKQAQTLYNKELREYSKIMHTDNELLENPYLLYESTRNKIDALKVSIKKVDLAFFPMPNVKNQYPIEAPSNIESENDSRRVRALAVSILEKSALEGHTIMPMNNLVIQINQLTVEPPCPVNGDIVAAMNDYFKDEIVCNKDALGREYYKLVRYKKIDHIINSQIKKRVNSTNRHIIDVDWRARVDEELKYMPNDDALEERARQEKAAALKEMAEARVSVLIGGAGTGKTTVLSILCQEKRIQDDGILLLAPTGKASVRMTQLLKGKTKFRACTIASFLNKSGRYDPATYNYRILEGAERGKDKPISEKTVIIDECSMLTEEMFGALLDAVKYAERIIFVGDANQLPPIGAGRPFVDLLRYLRSVSDIEDFPKVGRSYAELITTRRQLPDKKTGTLRADVRLAKWYTEDTTDMDEAVFREIQSGTKDGTVIFKRWNDKDELERILLHTIAELCGMKNIDDIEGFNRYLGATVYNDNNKTLFYASKDKDKEMDDIPAERWQILSPVRNNAHGVLNINHLIHGKYRAEFLEMSVSENSKIPNQMGPENIVYGDKVINVVNSTKEAYPQDNAENFVANGEIGIVCGHYGSGKARQYLKIEYTTQKGYTYSYTESEFNGEGTIPLELAYALTVHKAQGSQFEDVILVLDDKCILASKELLYTALTRQRGKLIILYNEDAFNLRKFSYGYYSDVAKRFTDLFTPPKIRQINNRYYEEDLIHCANNGTMVRSKSEVIIANMLSENGYDDFLYEEPLAIGDSYFLPDFTIKDKASGNTIIWEHCGMMDDEDYRKRWEKKKRVYEANGYSEANGNLIVTEETKNTGLNSSLLQEKIDEYL